MNEVVLFALVPLSEIFVECYMHVYVMSAVDLFIRVFRFSLFSWYLSPLSLSLPPFLYLCRIEIDLELTTACPYWQSITRVYLHMYYSSSSVDNISRLTFASVGCFSSFYFSPTTSRSNKFMIRCTPNSTSLTTIVTNTNDNKAKWHG